MRIAIEAVLITALIVVSVMCYRAEKRAEKALPIVNPSAAPVRSTASPGLSAGLYSTMLSIELQDPIRPPAPGAKFDLCGTDKVGAAKCLQGLVLIAINCDPRNPAQCEARVGLQRNQEEAAELLVGQRAHVFAEGARS